MWKHHNPDLVVHVGVSGVAEELTIETLAHNEGYKRLDVTGNTAPSQCYLKNGCDCLATGFDVEKLCNDINGDSCLAMAVQSNDAGRYLCEYIFYASLSQKTSCVSFIHVPPLGEPYSAQELGDGLRCAILGMLKQLDLYHPLPLPSPEVVQQFLEQNTGASGWWQTFYTTLHVHGVLDQSVFLDMPIVVIYIYYNNTPYGRERTRLFKEIHFFSCSLINYSK